MMEESSYCGSERGEEGMKGSIYEDDESKDSFVEGTICSDDGY